MSDAKVEEVKQKPEQQTVFEKGEEEEEGEEIAYTDIYVRFNDDQEKDYCFQINTKTRFRDLDRIFETLPLSLRPSIFYHARPIGYRKSTSPGYLTEDGNFIFDNDAGKIKSSIFPPDELINNHVWPGQLILPEWEFNYFAFYSLVLALLAWLYTDLPDFISPTPGICLTNQITRVLSSIAVKYGYNGLAAKLMEDIEDDVSIPLQCIFFAFHVIKLFFLFGFLYTGVFNPIKLLRFNLFGNSNVKLNVTKEELVELGWTGTKKATIDDYKDYYRELKIEEHGGMIPAHQAGLFQVIKHLGVQLKEGEGYNTPLVKENMDRPLKEIVREAQEDASNFKFKLSYEWFVELGYVFAAQSQDKEGKELTDLIKQFRRYGLIASNEKIKTVVQARKSQEKFEVPLDERPLKQLPVKGDQKPTPVEGAVVETVEN
ncbi:GSF2 [Candida oxycetoniae]|uniref:GSF2 n=1 Tax=Candida oxycetoniae TaxID=497107 RepID=A0AAI9WYZ3_9ASCO|nr:GSF2 [Candida oxycetoniae]KAI3405365.1 GSF2 [Candida oxycetoniae]